MKIKGIIERFSIFGLVTLLFILNISFNVYAYGELFIDIPIYVDKSVGTEQEYQIFAKLNSESVRDHLVENEVIAMKDGKIELSFKEPGVFIYKIYEKNGSNKNIIYDDTVYKLYCYVENSKENEEKLKSFFVSYNNMGEKKEKIYFKNRYIESTSGGNGKRASIKDPNYSYQDNIDIKEADDIEDITSKDESRFEITVPRTYDENRIYIYGAIIVLSVFIGILIRKIK